MAQRLGRRIAVSRLLLLALLCTQAGVCQDSGALPQTVEEMNKLKQNPVSGLKTVFFQNINMPAGTGTANAFSIQPVWPFRVGHGWKMITYTIVSIQHIPPPVPDGASASGLGNVTFNGFFRPEKSSGKFLWSAGPALQFPTRTDPSLGSNRVSGGPAMLLFGASGQVSGGVVAQNLWSFGGSGVNKVNLFSLQYFANYNLRDGWSILTNATSIADWQASSDRWLLPVGGGVGRTFKLGKLFYSATAQGFYNALRPNGVGNWQAIGQFQVIFGQ